MSGERVRLTPPDYEPALLEQALQEPPTAATELSLAVPAQPSAAPEPSLAVRELQGFDPRLLPALPLATTLVCRPASGDGQLVVTTSKPAYEAAKAHGVPVFAGGELLALSLAAEHERASPAAMAEWCAHKAEDPAWRLTSEVAIGGAVGSFEPEYRTLGQTLRAYGLELIEVCVGDELPTLLEQPGGES